MLSCCEEVAGAMGAGKSPPICSDEVLRLLPLGLEREDLVPVPRYHVGDIRLVRQCRAPADGVAREGMMVGAQSKLAIGAERGGDGQSLQHFGELGTIRRVGLLGRRSEELNRGRVLPRPVGRVL